MGKIIGIISIKGGVGKTTTVSNLAAVYSQEFKKSVLVVDANFSAPNMAYHLGIKDFTFGLHDVLSDKIPALDAIVSHTEGFDVLPSAMGSPQVDVFDLKEKITYLKDFYDIILLDSSPSLTNEILATMITADELYAVTTPDVPTLKCTVHAVKAANKKKVTINGIILNRVKNKSYEVSIADIEHAVEVPVLAVLPDENNVAEALSKAKTATLHKPSKGFSTEYKKLAGALISQEYQDKQLFSKVKKIFGSQPKQEINRIAFIKGL